MLSLKHPPFQHSSDEVTRLTVRHHPVILFGYIFLFIFVTILSLVVAYILDVPQYLDMNQPLALALTLIGINIYILSGWLFFCGTFLSVYLDVWIITNKRLINIQQHTLFSRTVSQQPLYRIQDVAVQTKGLSAHIFGYGTIEAQTAGEDENFSFATVSQPESVAHKILNLIEEERKKNPGAFSEALGLK